MKDRAKEFLKERGILPTDCVGGIDKSMEFKSYYLSNLLTYFATQEVESDAVGFAEFMRTKGAAPIMWIDDDGEHEAWGIGNKIFTSGDAYAKEYQKFKEAKLKD